MNLFVIPTNTKLQNALPSIIKEMEYSNYKNQLLLVVDNGSEEVYSYNSKRIRNEYGSLKVIHIGKSDMKILIRSISTIMGVKYSRLEKLLLPRDGDYGSVSNIIYIYAVLLQAESIHRRDSDCDVFGLTNKSFPITQEEKFINKQLKNIKNQVNIIEKSSLNQKDKVLIVGSDYLGDYNMDFSLIQTQNGENNQSVIELFQMMGIPDDAISNQIKTKYGTKNYCTHQKPLLKTSFNVSEYPDCGNVAMTLIYEYIPNFIGIKGIGYDYNTYFFAFLFKVPILYHFNKINHSHFVERKSIVQQSLYWKGIYKQVCLDNLLTYFIQNHLDRLLNTDRTGIKLIQNLIEDKSFIAALSNSSSMIHETNSESLTKLIKLLTETKQDNSLLVANNLNVQKENLINEVNKDFQNSLELLKIWPEIIDAVKKLSEEKEIKQYESK